MFSQVSGLDQSGSMHGVIASVSQPEATRALADHLGDVVELLTKNVALFETADTAIAGAIGSLGLGGAAASNTWNDAVAPMLTANVINPTTTPFDATAAVASRPLSLDVLTAQLAASDIGSMTAIAANWADTASTVATALMAVPEALSLIHI